MNAINVVSRVQYIRINPITSAVSVERAGPQGPRGLQGPAGVGGGSYLHTQSVASTSWLINHGLGFKPNVDVFDETGRRIRAAVIHHTDNQTELQFLSVRTGEAHLS